jgi:hypothetical protein
VESIHERVGSGPVYLTFDLDVLDPAAAPAVSNLEPGEEGLTMKEALRVLRGMRGLDIVGADVVCLMPTKDNPNQITSLNTVAFSLSRLPHRRGAAPPDVTRRTAVPAHRSVSLAPKRFAWGSSDGYFLNPTPICPGVRDPDRAR